MKKLYLFLIPVLWCTSAQAKIKTEKVEYKHGETILQGSLSYDDKIRGKRPGIIVVHEWWGFGPYAQGRAEQLAKLGYIAFAIDMYGKGIRALNHQQAAGLSNIYRSDRHLMRERALEGLKILKNHKLTKKKKIAAIGYCFGGTTALEMARAGYDLKGVVTFHGGLQTPHPEDAKNIKGRILVLHGADEQFVSAEEVATFQDEMRKGQVDWQMIYYGGAVHSFTVPSAGDDPSQGTAYNEKADKRSWKTMKSFFNEIFD